MFKELEKINRRPSPFEVYTALDLWNDEHTSKQMLAFHLNEAIDVSSRKATFIDRSVEWIVRRFQVNEFSRIADFGCGPGLYANRLAREKADVTGIDFSERSIRYGTEAARREGLKTRFVNQNYLDFTTEDRFDLIIMIMCDFCALSPSQRKSLLRKFHVLLKPEGKVLLDVYSITAFNSREETTACSVNLLDGFWSPEKYYGFLNTFKYEEEKVVLDKYTIVEANRSRTIYNWLQYFSPGNLEKEFTENGFLVEELRGDVAGSVYQPDKEEFAVVARKG